MNFDELKQKAQDLVRDHGDQIESAAEKAGEFARGRISGHDDQIDGAVEKIKGLIPDDGTSAS